VAWLSSTMSRLFSSFWESRASLPFLRRWLQRLKETHRSGAPRILRVPFQCSPPWLPSCNILLDADNGKGDPTLVSSIISSTGYHAPWSVSERIEEAGLAGVLSIDLRNRRFWEIALPAVELNPFQSPLSPIDSSESQLREVRSNGTVTGVAKPD
jgi:hypothetical protein